MKKFVKRSKWIYLFCFLLLCALGMTMGVVAAGKLPPTIYDEAWLGADPEARTMTVPTNQDSFSKYSSLVFQWYVKYGSLDGAGTWELIDGQTENTYKMYGVLLWKGHSETKACIKCEVSTPDDPDFLGTVYWQYKLCTHPNAKWVTSGKDTGKEEFKCNTCGYSTERPVTTGHVDDSSSGSSSTTTNTGSGSGKTSSKKTKTVVTTEKAPDGSSVVVGTAFTAYGPLRQIVLKAQTITLKRGQKFNMAGIPAVVEGDPITSWSSDNPQVVKVSKTGLLTASKKYWGTATISAKTAGGKNWQLVVKVQKKAVQLKKLRVTPASVTLKVGESVQLAATITPLTAAQKLKFKSSKPKVASVTKKGLVTGKKKGNAVITVKCGKKSVKVKVKVVG